MRQGPESFIHQPSIDKITGIFVLPAPYTGADKRRLYRYWRLFPPVRYREPRKSAVPCRSQLLIPPATRS
jgi:hypothetical protein